MGAQVFEDPWKQKMYERIMEKYIPYDRVFISYCDHTMWLSGGLGSEKKDFIFPKTCKDYSIRMSDLIKKPEHIAQFLEQKPVEWCKNYFDLETSEKNPDTTEIPKKIPPHELCTDEKSMKVFLEIVDKNSCDYSACALRAAEHGFLFQIRDSLKCPIQTIPIAHALARRGTEDISDEYWNGCLRKWESSETFEDFHPVREWVKGVEERKELSEENKKFARVLMQIFDFKLYWTGMIPEFKTSCMGRLNHLDYYEFVGFLKSIARQEKDQAKFRRLMRSLEEDKIRISHGMYPCRRF